MLSCWKENVPDRPAFADLQEMFDSMLEQDNPYINFSIDPDKLYYNIDAEENNLDTAEVFEATEIQTDNLLAESDAPGLTNVLLPVQNQKQADAHSPSRILENPRTRSFSGQPLPLDKRCIEDRPHSMVQFQIRYDTAISEEERYVQDPSLTSVMVVPSDCFPPSCDGNTGGVDSTNVLQH